MSRGSWYTNLEDQRLVKLYKDNIERKYVEIAQMAIDYGICESRSVNGVAQHISILMNTPEDKEEQKERQLEIEEFHNSEAEIIKAERDKYKNLYELLTDTAIGGATLYRGPMFDGLTLDIKSLHRLLYRLEPEKIDAKVKELKEEEDDNNERN